MKWFWFPVAVVATSIALMVAVIGFFALPVRTAVASTIGLSGYAQGATSAGGPWHGGPWGNGSGFTLPTEIQSLGDIPQDQRFGHFVGVQVSLRDKDNKPLTLNVTPGTVTAASATSLSVAANDGTAKTYALNDKTMVHGASAPPSGAAASTVLSNGDNVVVVTIDGSSTATAVMDGGPHGFSWSGPRGPGHPAGVGH